MFRQILQPPNPSFPLGEHLLFLQVSKDSGQVQNQIHGIFRDFIHGIGHIQQNGIQIVLLRHFPEYLADRQAVQAQTSALDHGNMRSQIRIGSVHLSQIILRILPVPFRMHSGIMQDKRRWKNKWIADFPRDNAHLDPLGRSVRIQFDDHIHVFPFLGFRQFFTGHHQKIQVAFPGLIAAHRRGAMQINSGQFFLQDGSGTVHKPRCDFRNAVMRQLQNIPDVFPLIASSLIMFSLRTSVFSHINVLIKRSGRDCSDSHCSF